MAELLRMIEETHRDRMWFRAEAQRTRVHGMFIDAAACAIRENALRDALAAIRRDPMTHPNSPGQ